MTSKRIKHARAHLSRRKHIAILATPLRRRTRRSDSNCLPRPFSVTRAALRAIATKRIKIMAEPKPKSRAKFESLGRTQHPAQLARTQLREEADRPGVDATRPGEPSKRILDLSLPKKSALLHARKYCSSTGNRQLLANVLGALRAVRRSRYGRYRVICNSLAQRANAREAKLRKKLHRALGKPADWERHNRVLERLAAPRPPPPLPPRSHHKKGASDGKGARSFDPARLIVLAQPIAKRTSDGRDPFAVQPSALTYNITERVQELASPRSRDQPHYREPGLVSPRALHFTATDRLVELAKPAVRQPGVETNLKENAFAVLPRALKAICRPRVKVLAKPKQRVRKF